MIDQGYTETEIARALGRSPSWLSENLASLRRELLARNGRLRDLTQAEHDALENSILEVGVQHPISIALVNGRLDMIDGRNRYQISLEHGLTHQLPWVYLGELDPDQARKIAFALNAARRMLTHAEKIDMVTAMIDEYPDMSSRSIAAACGVTHPTVEARRTKLQADRDQLNTTQLDPAAQAAVERFTTAIETPPTPKTRRGSDGHTRTYHPKPPTATTMRQNATTQTCPTCGGTGTITT